MISESKLEAFRREFPFLDRYLKKRWLEEDHYLDICVERTDPQLLKETPFIDEINDEDAHYYLLGRDGSELAVVQLARLEEKPAGQRRWWKPSTWGKKVIPAETVEQAVRRLQDPSAVGYVLRVCTDNTSSYWVDAEIVIYKVPKQFSILECREAEVHRHQKALTEAIKQIDNK